MSFKYIKGHNQPISLLKIALSQKRNASTYLFTGEEGIGKSLVAKTVAKAANCLTNNDFDSCDQCISCKKIDNFNHPDIHWINPGGTNNTIKIEQIRQLKSDISLKSYEAQVKVFIIDGAHYLTSEAQNAFLKILEEPPKDSLIILISSKPKLIFPTIISRCQKLRFRPLEKNQLKQLLLTEFKLDNTLSHFLSYFYEGRIGKVLNLKQKDILEEKNAIIDEFVLHSNVDSKFVPSNRIYENMGSNKDKFKDNLNILASWFRDLYFIKVGMPYAELINFDRKADLLKIMNRYSFLDLDSIVSFISDNILYLDQNINPKLLLSNLRLRLWKG